MKISNRTKLMRDLLFGMIFFVRKISGLIVDYSPFHTKSSNHFKKNIGLLLLLLFPIFQHAGAQQKTEIIDIYDTQDGLPSNLINSITQDQMGYIWIATSMGLCRFDGKNFINLSSKNHPEFFEDDIVDSFLEKDGFIYLISMTGGIIRLDPTTLKIKRITKQGIYSIDYYDNTLLILFADSRLLLIDKNFNRVWRKFDQNKLGKAIIQENGIFISFLNEQPQRLDKKNLSTDFTYETKDMGSGGGFFRLNKEKVLFHTGKKLFELSINSSTPFELAKNSDYEITYFNNKDKNAICYIANYNTPYFVQNESIVGIEFKELKKPQIRIIFQTDENSSLIGTNQGIVHIRRFTSLVSQIDDSPFYSYPDMRVRRKILEGNNGELILAGYPNILVTDNVLKYLYINDAVKIHNRYYMGSYGNGLWEVDSSLNAWNNITTEGLNSGDKINTLLQAENKQLLIGGVNRLSLLDLNTGKACQANLGENTTINKLVIHPQKKYYVAGSNKGILFIFLNQNCPVIYPRLIEGIKDAKDFLFIPEKNEMWTATDNGLYVLDMISYSVKKKYVTPEEISNPRVTALVRDNSNRIWASTYSGITAYGEQIFMLGPKNGLENIEFNYNSVLKRKNGDLVFGGLTTYDVINPDIISQFSFKENFEISAFEKISQKKGGQFYFSTNTKPSVYSFFPDKEDLKLYFSNFDYRFGNLYRFFYKIDNGSWNEIKQDRFLVLSNLPTGNQKLTIKMISPLGAKAAEKSVLIRAEVLYYKHPSFLIILLSLLLTFVLISYYFLQKTRRIEAQTKERIAMDLHDETGTILTRLLFLSGRKNMSQPEQDNIKSGLQEALLSLRSFMESLYRKEVSATDLKDEINEFVQKTFSGSPVTPEIHFQLGSLQKVNPELFRDIKLCIYELITNFIKHSQGEHFTLQIATDKRQLVIRTTDDGTFTHGSELNSKGNGIRNMQNRVLRHDGIIIFNQNFPSGLKTELRFTL